MVMPITNNLHNHFIQIRPQALVRAYINNKNRTRARRNRDKMITTNNKMKIINLGNKITKQFTHSHAWHLWYIATMQIAEMRKENTITEEEKNEKLI